MKQFSTILPCYAADTSGVCSALYELGGMTVVHDASGCNSTYATHDEPRWYDHHAMIYISALTETDAILGEDTRFIDDVCTAAADQSPRFITLCGSPMPMMIGTDFDAVAAEIEHRTGIRTLALHTNGTRSYLVGASEAFCTLMRAFARPAATVKRAVNILGATPLDLELHDTIPAIRHWLADNGFSVACCAAMNDNLENIAARAAAAEVSLVVSYAGLAAAEYLYTEFGIPYVVGIPVGTRFSALLAESLYTAIATGEPQYPCAVRSSGNIVTIGESVTAGSIAASVGGRVICPLEHTPNLLGTDDSAAFEEREIKTILQEIQPDTVILDPLYRYILPEKTKLIEVPHFAFSGRCFQKNMRCLVGKDL